MISPQISIHKIIGKHDDLECYINEKYYFTILFVRARSNVDPVIG